MDKIQNWIGQSGAYLSRAMFFLFGIRCLSLLTTLFVLHNSNFLPTTLLQKKRFFHFDLFFNAWCFNTILRMWPQYFVSITDYLRYWEVPTSPGHALSGGVIGQFLAGSCESAFESKAGF